MTSVRFPDSQIWKPDILLYNRSVKHVGLCNPRSPDLYLYLFIWKSWMGFDWRPTSQKGVRVYNVAGKWAGKKCKDTKSLRRGEENKELASFVNVFWKESSPEELIMFCCIPAHHVEINFSRMNSPSPCPLCWSVQQLIKMRVTAMPKVAGCVTRSHFILLLQDYTVECKWLHPVWFLNVEKKKLSTKMYASKKIKVVLVFIMNEHTSQVKLHN